MKNPQWGQWFRISRIGRQLDTRELDRYADYCVWCREVIHCEPAMETIWGLVNHSIPTV
jgi:hypothetical protein